MNIFTCESFKDICGSGWRKKIDAAETCISDQNAAKEETGDYPDVEAYIAAKELLAVIGYRRDLSSKLNKLEYAVRSLDYKVLGASGVPLSSSSPIFFTQFSDAREECKHITGISEVLSNLVRDVIKVHMLPDDFFDDI